MRRHERRTSARVQLYRALVALLALAALAILYVATPLHTSARLPQTADAPDEPNAVADAAEPADEQAAVQRAAVAGMLPAAAQAERSATAQAERPASTTANQPAAVPWLRVVIPSVGRNPEKDYLLRTLDTLCSTAPSSMGHPIRSGLEIVAVNNHDPPAAHAVFAQARIIFAQLVTFIDTVVPPGGCAQNARLKKVTPKVQKQTCGLVSAIQAVLALRTASEHVLMMEDDWLLCPNGLFALSYFIDKATRYDPRWIALRVSYGFNGIVLRWADMRSLQTHLASGVSRRPPDHLVYEWFSGERPETKEYADRRSFRIFRHNLFYHIGSVSTLQPAGRKRYTPGCFSLLYDWLLPSEVFNVTACPHDDVSPCVEADVSGISNAFPRAPLLQWSGAAWDGMRPLEPSLNYAPDLLPRGQE
jgi:hypothetical protein